jgi:hypothetical protein
MPLQQSRRRKGTRKQNGGLFGMSRSVIQKLIKEKNLGDDNTLQFIKDFFIIQSLKYKNKMAGGVTARMIALANGHTNIVDYLDDENIYNETLKYVPSEEDYTTFRNRILSLCSNTSSGITATATGMTTKEIQRFFLDLGQYMNALTKTDCSIIFQGDEDTLLANLKALQERKYPRDQFNKYIYSRTGIEGTQLHDAANRMDESKGLNDCVNVINDNVMLTITNYVTSKTNGGKTAADFARAKGYMRTLDFIISVGGGNSVGGRRKTRSRR